MKLPCETIRDLLPLYHDGVCSAQSVQAVEEHLLECPSCAEALEAIRAEVQVKKPDTPEDISAGDAMRTLARRWRRSKILMGIAWAAVAAAVMVIGFIIHNVLFVRDTVPIPASQVAVGYTHLDLEGNFQFRLRIKDGKEPNASSWHSRRIPNEEGGYTEYIVALRPRIVLGTKVHAFTGGVGWGIQPDVTHVYYGTPEDRILLWEQEQGMYPFDLFVN
ncbi:MAG: zf-HC2 domain-containing protein [Clostridia bacterium]|nr:zf-HC2 domain-containing protein [Clostridia bacterium]